MGYEREHTHPPDDAPRSTVQARPAVTAGGAITAVYESAMVTSTSTFGSMLMDVICFTMLAGECRSSRRLWMRISYRSYVLVPSPHGLLRVVIRRVLVGRRTGPDTLSSFCSAPFFRSAHTFSRDLTL